jgi:hypothetical protein
MDFTDVCDIDVEDNNSSQINEESKSSFNNKALQNLFYVEGHICLLSADFDHIDKISQHFNSLLDLGIPFNLYF